MTGDALLLLTCKNNNGEAVHVGGILRPTLRPDYTPNQRWKKMCEGLFMEKAFNLVQPQTPGEEFKAPAAAIAAVSAVAQRLWLGHY